MPLLGVTRVCASNSAPFDPKPEMQLRANLILNNDLLQPMT
jgi:hypothetical protein